MRVVPYLRVSKDKQDAKDQARELPLAGLGIFACNGRASWFRVSSR